MTFMTKTFTAAAVAALFPALAFAQDNLQWQGGYAGVMMSEASADWSVGPGLFDDATASTFELMAGYNHALGTNWVVGGEVTAATGPSTPQQAIWPYGIDNEVSARLRAGYATGGVLLYGGVGYTQADISQTFIGSVDTAEGASYFIGGEMMMSDTISARIEYSQTELDGDFFGPNQSETMDQVSIGVAYHF